jgi:hypothetical protein
MPPGFTRHRHRYSKQQLVCLLFVCCASVLHFGFTPSLTTVASLESIKLFLPFCCFNFSAYLDWLLSCHVLFFVVVVENAAFFLTTSIAIEFFLQLPEYIIQLQSKKENFLGLILALVELLVQNLSVTLVCLRVASFGEMSS